MTKNAAAPTTVIPVNGAKTKKTVPNKNIKALMSLSMAIWWKAITKPNSWRDFLKREKQKDGADLLSRKEAGYAWLDRESLQKSLQLWGPGAFRRVAFFLYYYCTEYRQGNFRSLLLRIQILNVRPSAGTVKLTKMRSFSRRNPLEPRLRISDIAAIATSEISMKSLNLTIPS
jgi:hypothetical protein